MINRIKKRNEEAIKNQKVIKYKFEEKIKGRSNLAPREETNFIDIELNDNKLEREYEHY